MAVQTRTPGGAYHGNSARAADSGWLNRRCHAGSACPRCTKLRPDSFSDCTAATVPSASLLSLVSSARWWWGR